jgi:hypothetical protein
LIWNSAVIFNLIVNFTCFSCSPPCTFPLCIQVHFVFHKFLIEIKQFTMVKVVNLSISAYKFFYLYHHYYHKITQENWGSWMDNWMLNYLGRHQEPIHSSSHFDQS